jgi:hypothetical protein
MTKPTSPTCACPDCPNPRRERSKYCSEKHQQRAARIKARERDPMSIVNYNHNHYSGIKNSHRAVTIIDPMVDKPFTITRSEFDTYSKQYREMNCKAFIDDQEIPYAKRVI